MRDGNYKKARNTLDILRKRGARKISQEYYYMAISACTKHGHVEHAFAVLEEMKADGLEPSILCYRRLIEGCAEHEWVFDEVQGGENASSHECVLTSLARPPAATTMHAYIP